MPIDLTQERVSPFSTIPGLNWIPPRRGGSRVSIQTLHRWRSPGLRGVRLEAVRCGGHWCTSAEALWRFFQRLTETAGPAPADGGRKQEGRHAVAEKALDDLDIR